MPDANQVTTLIVAASILVVAVALVAGGLFLGLGQGRWVLGIGLAVVGLGAGLGAFLFTLAPVVAARYRPGGPGEGGEG